MKLALFADIHANLEALTACLAHAKGQGADHQAFLGDLVGYGADPVAVLRIVSARVEAGALAVRGNHDEAALEPGPETMNRAASKAIAWTRDALPEDLRAFLAGLPLVERLGTMLFVHASADRPEAWTYVYDAAEAARSVAASDASYVFCGHVHEPMLYYTAAGGRLLPFQPVPGVAIPVPSRKRWLAIPGSVGQPRGGDPAARYAIVDVARATLTFHRIPYDWRAAAEKVRAAGLPESLAQRLEGGK